ncbi:MAG: ABC transporter permease [Gemmatimonadetes bacterium]|nr:ABC transporter permease [Gemmatimonadota bacterium]
MRREHELVVRAALGAGTARLRRLLLVENLLLAFAGAVLGLVIAVGGVRLLAAFAARYSPRANEIRIDGTVLAFALLLTVVVAVIISFAPTLAAEGKLGALIAAGASRVSGGMARQRLQRSLVVAQVAVSVILLTGAGLLTRTMMQLSEVQSGLTAEDVLTMEVPISGGGRSDADTKAMYARMREEIRGIPGVREVGLGSTMPLRSTQFQLDVKGEGHTLAAGEPQPRAEFRTADPDFFRAAGIPLLKGREFTSTDRDSSQRVVVINQTLANQLFQGRDAVGRRVAWTGEVLKFIGVSGDWRTVVGVVGDTKDGGLDADPRGVVFAPSRRSLHTPAGW